MPILSPKVGCGWMVLPISTASAPISIAKATSPIMSPACVPTMPPPRIRPWPWAILYAGKRIENRSWVPGQQFKPGDLIAIHAGSKWSQDDANWISKTFRVQVPPKSEHPAGAIVGFARYKGIMDRSRNQWFFGPWGWLLGDVQAIEPIPHRGALGLWRPNEEAQTKLQEQIAVLYG